MSSPITPKTIQTVQAGPDTDGRIARILGRLGIIRYSTIIHDALAALTEFCNTHYCGWKLGQYERNSSPYFRYYCQIKGGNIQHPNTYRITAAEADSPELAICRAIILTQILNPPKVKQP